MTTCTASPGNSTLQDNNNRSYSDASIPSVILCNTRSLAPKIDELASVCSVDSADIVCITESWLHENIPDSAEQLEDYVLFRNDRPSHAGGVAAYVRCTIPSRLPVLELNDSVSETLWIRLRPRRLPRSISMILLAVIYHPPRATANYNEVLYAHVQRTFYSFMKSHKDCLVCVTGDFNSTSTHISPSIFRQRCSLSQIIKVLTRDTGILDWFLTNNPKCWSPPCQLPKISTVLIKPVTPAAKPAKACDISRYPRQRH